jgi:hypothetical protein
VESGGRQRTRKGTRKVYQVVMRGELSARYAAAFEGMEMEAANGRTVLTGEVKDQPHLSGILDRINGLGLQLVSVLCVSDEPRNGTQSNKQTADDGHRNELEPPEPGRRRRRMARCQSSQEWTV